MQEFIITTCPHCGKEFEQKVLNIICGGVRHEDAFNPYKAKLLEFKRCPLCEKLIDINDPNQYKHRLRYEEDPLLPKAEDLKWWIKKFLP